MIAGTNSDVGKTTISYGLMALATKMGKKVQAFKVGPDYIDPSYHTLVTGNHSRNLDEYLIDRGNIENLFLKNIKDSDYAIVEGVMGLYDGFGSKKDFCSSYSMAKILNLPIILVISAKGASTSCAAIVAGFKALDNHNLIKGVIINKVASKEHFNMIKESIKEYTNVEVFGYLTNNKKFKTPSRHLGLIPATEKNDFLNNLNDLALDLKNNIDWKLFYKYIDEENIYYKKNSKNISSMVKLGVAYDDAFNFYYKDALETLEENEVELIYFSPLKDKKLPNVDGLYFGGGFPEIFAKELQENESMKKEIRNFHLKNKPIYAECGGYMYLSEAIIDSNSNIYSMVGIIPSKSIMKNKLVNFGYCNGKVLQNSNWFKMGDVVKGHEFHYSQMDFEKENFVYENYKIRDGEIKRVWKEGFQDKNLLATYVHIHFSSNKKFVENWIKIMKESKIND